MKFIVEVRPPLPEDLAEVAEKLAEAFNISSAKANGLLRRAPGPVTKPVSEREASVVAGIFESAGLSVTTLPEAEVLSSTVAAKAHDDPDQTPPADVAGYAAEDVAEDLNEVERPAAEFGGAAVSDDTTAEMNGHTVDIEDEDAASASADDGHDGGYVRLGEVPAASTVMEPLRDDGLDDEGQEDELLSGNMPEPDTLHHVGLEHGLSAGVDRLGGDQLVADDPGGDPLGVDRLDADGLSVDDAYVNDTFVDGINVDSPDVDDPDMDDPELDYLQVDRLGADMAEVDQDGIVGPEGESESEAAAEADGLGTDVDLGYVREGVDGDTSGADEHGDGEQGAGFGAPDGTLIAGAAAVASRWVGAGDESEGAEGEQAGSEQAGSEQAAAEPADSDEEPSVSTSGTAPVYRSGVRELQRHGGTTAAELGMHARNATQREAKPSGVRRRIVAVGIWPALLTLLVVVVGAALTLLPVVRYQQAAAANRTASSFASSVEGVSAGLPLGAPIVNAVLSDIAGRSQARLVGQGVDYLVITDDQGLPLAGWYRDAATLTNLPPDVGRDVATAATAVAAGDAEVTPGETLVQSLAASWRDVLGMVGLGTFEAQVGSAAVRDGANLVGTVVVGMDPAPQLSDLGSALLTVLLLGLIPVLIGIFAALALARRVTGGLRYLLDAADSISRGDLEHAVQLDSKDELGQLARAIERMRVSLQEGLERLRRRR